MHAALKHQSSVGMPEVMEADMRQPCFPNELTKGVGNCTRVQVPAIGRAIAALIDCLELGLIGEE